MSELFKASSRYVRAVYLSSGEGPCLALGQHAKREDKPHRSIEQKARIKFEV